MKILAGIQRIGIAAAFSAVISMGSAVAGEKNPTQVLWDAWYTVTLKPGIAYAYYNDKVELHDGRIRFQNHFWKKEEGYINEERLGAFAEHTPELRPLFFNFHSSYRNTETKIDGTLVDGKMLNVRVTKSGKEQPIIRKSVPKKAFLSVFFPFWVKNQLPKLKPKRNVSFSAILEDNPDVGYRTVAGRIRLEEPDDFAKRTKTSKLDVRFKDTPSTWYVDSDGVPLRIEMHAMTALVERVDAAAAAKFLEFEAPLKKQNEE